MVSEHPMIVSAIKASLRINRVLHHFRLIFTSWSYCSGVFWFFSIFSSWNWYRICVVWSINLCDIFRLSDLSLFRVILCLNLVNSLMFTSLIHEDEYVYSILLIFWVVCWSFDLWSLFSIVLLIYRSSILIFAISAIFDFCLQTLQSLNLLSLRIFIYSWILLQLINLIQLIKILLVCTTSILQILVLISLFLLSSMEKVLITGNEVWC